MSMTIEQMQIFASRSLILEEKCIPEDIGQNIKVYSEEIEAVKGQGNLEFYQALLIKKKNELMKICEEACAKFAAHGFEHMKIQERLETIQKLLRIGLSVDNPEEAVYRRQLRQAESDILLAKKKIEEENIHDVFEALKQIPPVSRDFPEGVRRCYQEFLEEKRPSLEAAQRRFDTYNFYNYRSAGVRLKAIQQVINVIGGGNIHIEDNTESQAFQYLLHQAQAKIQEAYEVAEQQFQQFKDKTFNQLTGNRKRYIAIDKELAAQRGKLRDKLTTMPQAERNTIARYLVLLIRAREQERLLLAPASASKPSSIDIQPLGKPIIFRSCSSNTSTNSNAHYSQPPNQSTGY